MRHDHHADTQLRLAIAEPQESSGYVDALLGLAREQTLARQAMICRALLRDWDEAAAHGEPVESGAKLH